MGTARNQTGSGLGFWRKLVSAAAIYALVMQPLLVALVGTQFAQAAALEDVALSQLCSHQTGGSPAAPADQHPSHNHCLLCFAGAFHLLDAPDPTTVSAVVPEIRKLGRSAHRERLSPASQYSIARPRGPPLRA
jgi:hypothetical protein